MSNRSGFTDRLRVGAAQSAGGMLRRRSARRVTSRVPAAPPVACGRCADAVVRARFQLLLGQQILEARADVAGTV